MRVAFVFSALLLAGCSDTKEVEAIIKIFKEQCNVPIKATFRYEPTPFSNGGITVTCEEMKK